MIIGIMNNKKKNKEKNFTPQTLKMRSVFYYRTNC